MEIISISSLGMRMSLNITCNKNCQIKKDNLTSKAVGLSLDNRNYVCVFQSVY